MIFLSTYKPVLKGRLRSKTEGVAKSKLMARVMGAFSNRGENRLKAKQQIIETHKNIEQHWTPLNAKNN